ncbi:MAG: T9SS type A sorting domain-containing protein [Burkholderiales bacterium]|nr:T9SS type A sorting domain-containing protein [Bacteroidia bacterium]
MNTKFTTLLLISISLIAFSQTQIPNAGFETWGNSAPGVAAEPTGWFSNKSGSSVAKLGPQICFQDNTVKHSGSSSVRVETLSYFGTAVNGAVTTGVINAPNTTKSNGYIGTVNYTTASDIRRTLFTGRPDSIVGWYQYTSGGAGEIGKVTAILHNNQYFDPETPITYHADPTSDKIARATYFGTTSNLSAWTRFSAPFVYTSPSAPAYIMINITCSANQATTITGSKMWVDDISFIYNNLNSVKELEVVKNAKVFYYDKIVYVDFPNKNAEHSTLEIYNVTGQLVTTQQIDNSMLNTIDVSSYKSGIYMYKLNDKSKGKFGKLLID